jgi:hypothetical protein
MYPMGPLILGGGLNVTVLSYQDRLDFGFLTCPETAPDTDFIAAGVPLALEELEGAAGLAVENSTEPAVTNAPVPEPTA